MKPNRVEVPADQGHFQGEIYVGPVERLPQDGLCETARVNGALVVGHSESGHHHVVWDRDVRLLETKDPFVCYLVAEGAYADLVHEREYDTHATLALAFGEAGTGRKVIRQREMSPTGWVRAQD